MFKQLNKDVTLKIEGNNILHFINYLYKEEIEIKNIKYLDKGTCLIRIAEKDLKKLKKIKSTFEKTIVNYHGFLKLTKYIKHNKILIGAIVFGYILLMILSNLILNIEIYHWNKEVRDIVYKELELNNIKKLHFKKKYEVIEGIEKTIVNKHKDKIEWLEIEEVGTKYIVRVEERKIEQEKEAAGPRDIVSTKNAVIKKLEVSSGQIIKNINSYVKKGDVIVSGCIKSGEAIKDIVSSEGNIYGEVWYEIEVVLPINYKEKKIFNDTKSVLTVNIINKKIDIFNFTKYKNYDIESKQLLGNKMIPFGILLERRTKVEYIDSIYTVPEALSQGINIGKNKIKTNLSEKERILDEKVLNYELHNSKIYIDLFLSVYEEIGEYKEVGVEDDKTQ